MSESPFKKSERLNNLSYAIRGPIFDKAQQIEATGQKIINLNIGNPAPFGFDVPDEIIHDMMLNIRNAQGYSHHLVLSKSERFKSFSLFSFKYSQHNGYLD